MMVQSSKRPRNVPWRLNEVRHFRDVVRLYPFETWARIAVLHGHGRTARSVQMKARWLGLARGIRPRRVRRKDMPGVKGPNIARVLKEVATRSGRRVVDVAKDAGMNRRTVARWLRGYPPQLRLLVVWAKEAGSSAAEICQMAGI